jgi:nitrite reductase/ring-hydroxylating ferredoxin subunit
VRTLEDAATAVRQTVRIIDSDGCLVCPWHQAKYDVTTGRMLRGRPQGVFAKIPGLDATYKLLTKVLPFKRGRVEERGSDLYIE